MSALYTFKSPSQLSALYTFKSPSQLCLHCTHSSHLHSYVCTVHIQVTFTVMSALYTFKSPSQLSALYTFKSPSQLSALYTFRSPSQLCLFCTHSSHLHSYVCSVHIQVAFTVMSALEYLKADGDGKVRMLSILRFDFIITLATIEYVLQRLLPS